MVQRWHSGKRMAAYLQANRNVNSQNNRYHQQHHLNVNNSFSATQFQVGQPVSSQNFHSPLRSDQEGQRGSPFSRSPINLVGNARCSTKTPDDNEDATPWSGSTPPQKERLRVNATK